MDGHGGGASPGHQPWRVKWIAPSGQTRKQAPQPLHRAVSSRGSGTPPRRKEKRMACGGQVSAQLVQATPRCARQLAPMAAIWAQGAASGLARVSAPGMQAARHSPQKVHSPWAKSASGNPPTPLTKSPVGHASRQASQRVQLCSKAASAKAQGGRKGTLRPARSPRRNRRLASNMGVIHQGFGMYGDLMLKAHPHY